jgi:hypothetical protein
MKLANANKFTGNPGKPRNRQFNLLGAMNCHPDRSEAQWRDCPFDEHTPLSHSIDIALVLF